MNATACGGWRLAEHSFDKSDANKWNKLAKKSQPNKFVLDKNYKKACWCVSTDTRDPSIDQWRDGRKEGCS